MTTHADVRAEGARTGGTTATGTARTVLIVDDHRCFADLLSASLEGVAGIRVVGVAPDAETGVALARTCRPEIVVMDIQMPGEDGLLATQRIRSASPGTRVAVVTAHQDPAWISRAAQAGASAFIPKDGSLAEMISTLLEVGPGPMRVAPSARTHDRLGSSIASGSGTAAHERPGPPVALTARERDVLGCIGHGLQAKEIARSLDISVHTCRGYIKSVYAKLGASTRIEAVNRAHQLGLVDR